MMRLVEAVGLTAMLAGFLAAEPAANPVESGADADDATRDQVTAGSSLADLVVEPPVRADEDDEDDDDDDEEDEEDERAV
jgi:hypothetical protein